MKIRFGTPKRGFEETRGDVLVKVVAPSKKIRGTSSDVNNNSLVLHISYGRISFLFTGDMEKEQRESIDEFPDTTILKVSHHGSRNGTDKEFLEAISPSAAVISYGGGNSYGHPHKEVLDDLNSESIEILTTEGGDVIVETDGETFSARKEIPDVQLSSKFVGNLRSKVFHRLSCSSLPSEKNRIYFTSVKEATGAGYRPCVRCLK